MPTACPHGHASASTDYCDVCGELMTGAAPAPPQGSQPQSGPPPSAPGGPGAAGEGEGETCPQCTTPRTGRFCEVDGYDFETGSPSARRSPAVPTTQFTPGTQPGRGPGVSPTGYHRLTSGPAGTRPPAGWSAIVSADRAYFETVLADLGPDGGGLAFPPYSPDRRYLLVGPQVRIGRRSLTRGFTPEIDLSAAPEDPGVSHIHAVLLAKPDGGWVLVDPGSTNGTTLNDSTEPIEVNVEIPVRDGDRIHVGAWTTITLRKE
jgi:FHA domain-containing protein